MKCRRAKKLVCDHLDGRIADGDRINLERHLGDCPQCEVYASEIKRSLDFLHRAPQEEPDDNFNWNVRLRISKERAAIQEGIASQGALFRAWNVRYATSAVAAFAVIVVGGYLAFSAGVDPFDARDEIGNTAMLERDLEERPASDLPSPRPTEVDADGRADDRMEPAGDAVSEAKKPSGKRDTTPVMTRRNRLSGTDVVSLGGVATNDEVTSLPDPIGKSDGPAELDLDSLIKAELGTMDDAKRIPYLELQLHIIQSHIERCQAEGGGKP